MTSVPDKPISRPTFPYPTERTAPDLPETPLPRTRKPVSPEAVRRAARVRAFLQEVKLRRSDDRTLDGVRIIDHLSLEGGTIFYHLTREAREMLRDGFSLPWSDS